jgi:hypothetical protein
LAREPAERVQNFADVLRSAFVPVDLRAFPRTRVLNVDPPVLVVDDFLPHELCDRLKGAAEASGRMRRSRVGGADDGPGSSSGGGGGGGGAGANDAEDDGSIRTSTTLAIDRAVLEASPELDAALSALLERAEGLFGGGGGDGGGSSSSSDASAATTPAAAAAAEAAPGSSSDGGSGVQQPQQQQQQQQQQQRLRLRRGLFSRPSPSSPRDLVAELPQIARYLPDQHFLAHEDAFPPAAALRRGFQRRATLLVYLNDCARGGRTRFEHLGPLDVAPVKGRALVFFPAFRGGRPDARTLHAATDAAEGCEKWVFQLWLTSAVGGAAAGGGGAAAAAKKAAPLSLPPLPRGAGGGKGGKGKKRR